MTKEQEYMNELETQFRRYWHDGGKDSLYKFLREAPLEGMWQKILEMHLHEPLSYGWMVDLPEAVRIILDRDDVKTPESKADVALAIRALAHWSLDAHRWFFSIVWIATSQLQC